MIAPQVAPGPTRIRRFWANTSIVSSLLSEMTMPLPSAWPSNE